MTSLILSTATRFLLPLILLFSFFSFYRGHNDPGGGFIAGLVAASAIALYMIAYDVEAARRLVVARPHTIVGAGMLLSLASGVLAWGARTPFLTAQWLHIEFAGHLIDLGTPLLFDLGVYLVVLGSTVMMLFTLAEE